MAIVIFCSIIVVVYAVAIYTVYFSRKVKQEAAPTKPEIDIEKVSSILTNLKSLRVLAKFAYWDDNYIDGVPDTDLYEDPDIPINLPLAYKDEKGEWVWDITISLEADNFGEIYKWPIGKEATIGGKVGNTATYIIDSKLGEKIDIVDKFPPFFLSDNGTYLNLEIGKDGYIKDFRCDEFDLFDLIIK